MNTVRQCNTDATSLEGLAALEGEAGHHAIADKHMVDTVPADVVVSRAVPDKGAFNILQDLPNTTMTGVIQSWYSRG